MAFSAGGDDTVRSDINITPLVDVVLVLLIIFMVMTPQLIKEEPVEVPEKADVVTTPPPSTSDQVTVGITATGTITVNKEPIPQARLVERMHQLLDNKSDKTVFFAVDDEAIYGDAVHVMDVCRGAGAKVLGLMTR
jgi:biopolymer transport protein ExbD